MSEVEFAREQVVAARAKADAAEERLNNELLGQNRAPLVDRFEKQLHTANRQLEEAQATYRQAIAGASAATAAGPESIPVHQSTIEFWKWALSGGRLQAGEVLQLPRNLYGNGHRVFVREAYVELAELVVGKLARGEVAHTGVYGTPGIGKSIFASLLVAFIGAASAGGAHHATVLYHAAHSMSSGGFLAFFSDGSVRYISISEAKTLLARESVAGERLVWVIADGKKAPEEVVEAVEFSNVLRTTTISSSNMGKHDWLAEWNKHVSFASLMPPFSLDELLLAAELKGAPPTEEARQQLRQLVRDRWLVFGGVPRAVLGASMYKVEQWLLDRVPRESNMLLRALRDTSHGDGTQGVDRTSRIIHLYPGTPERAAAMGCHRLEYAARVARFASPVVRERLVANLNAASRHEAAQRLSSADTHGDGEAVALLFEPWMHAFIQRGCTFVFEQAAPGPLVQLAAGGMLEREFFATHTTLAEAPIGRYMQPDSASYPSVDSFVKFADGSVRLFQMTGQERHPINMPGLKALFAVPVGTPGGHAYKEGGKQRCVLVPNNTVLVFVLMPSRAQSFVVPQPFVSKSRGAALKCTGGAALYISSRIVQRKASPASWDQ